MDIKTIFSPLQKIYFMRENMDAEEDRIYHSRIEEVGDNELTVVEPYGHGFYLPRHYQQTYLGRVILDNCAYLFKTRLINYLSDGVPLWVIAMPTEIRRDQLRNFVRLSVNLDVKIAKLVEETDSGEISEGEQISTLTQNISGSGAGIILPEALPLGSKVKVFLPLDRHVVEAVGEVIRVNGMEPDYDKYYVGINFTQIEETSRKILIRYIFHKQIARRKKEAELFE